MCRVLFYPESEPPGKGDCPGSNRVRAASTAGRARESAPATGADRFLLASLPGQPSPRRMFLQLNVLLPRDQRALMWAN